MNIINGVFKGVLEINIDQIIKTVDIDSITHKNGIINICRYLEPNFKLIPENKEVLNKLFMYFTGQKLSELDLSKGLAIFGEVGTGKSLIMKVFKEYTREILRANSFLYFDVKDIIANVNISGNQYFEEINKLNGKHTTIYIDDLASGNEVVKNYGTEINVIEHLLTLRYIIYNRYGKLTHLTSNKYPSELATIYGTRITDRMKEMFNIIELNCDSFRK